MTTLLITIPNPLALFAIASVVKPNKRRPDLSAEQISLRIGQGVNIVDVPQQPNDARRRRDRVKVVGYFRKVILKVRGVRVRPCHRSNSKSYAGITNPNGARVKIGVAA